MPKTNTPTQIKRSMQVICAISWGSTDMHDAADCSLDECYADGNHVYDEADTSDYGMNPLEILINREEA